MSGISIMALAAQKADWLSVRQSTLAQNVANANTPGYKAKDVVPFESILDNTSLSMMVSNSQHMNISGGTGRAAEMPKVEENANGDSTYTRNTVSLENELMKLGETNSQFALNTGLIKSFNRMIMASLKG